MVLAPDENVTRNLSFKKKSIFYFISELELRWFLRAISQKVRDRMWLLILSDLLDWQTHLDKCLRCVCSHATYATSKW